MKGRKENKIGAREEWERQRWKLAEKRENEEKNETFICDRGRCNGNLDPSPNC